MEEVKPSLDIEFPATYFKQFVALNSFSLIYPKNSKVIEGIDCTSSARLLGFLDSEFFEEGATKTAPKYKTYYDILYIRECAIQYVTPEEWKYCYGPTDSLEFMSFYEDKTFLDGYVKVICCAKPKHNLKKLRNFIDPIEVYS